MQSLGLIPHTMLMPAQNLATHIGIDGGMHAHKAPKFDKLNQLDTLFYGTELIGKFHLVVKKAIKPFGGWGHPSDQNHCMKLLSMKVEMNKPWKL